MWSFRNVCKYQIIVIHLNLTYIVYQLLLNKQSFLVLGPLITKRKKTPWQVFVSGTQMQFLRNTMAKNVNKHIKMEHEYCYFKRTKCIHCVITITPCISYRIICDYLLYDCPYSFFCTLPLQNISFMRIEISSLTKTPLVPRIMPGI